MNFGERVKYLLKKYDLSQQEFAGRLGITNARLNNYLCNKTEAGYDILRMIALSLNTTLDYLLGRSLKHNSASYGKDEYSPPFRVFHNDTIEQPEISHFLQLPVYCGSFGGQNPVGWSKIAVSDRELFNQGYCIKVCDDSMAPLILLGDFVYISKSPPLINPGCMDDGVVIYAVRLSSDDEIGLSLRRCFKKGSTLFLLPASSRYKPEWIDISKKVNPIVGKVIALTRVYSGD